MTGQDYMEEIDCASFFDHIDDLIEFPPVNDTSLDSVHCNDFINIWTNNSDNSLVSDSVFIGSRGDNYATETLSADLSVPYDDDIVQLEWLSNFVDDSYSGGGTNINEEDNVLAKEEKVIVRHQFQTSSPVSVLESSSSSSSSSYSGSGKMTTFSPIQRGPQKARSKRPRPTTFNPRAMNEFLSALAFVPVSSSVSEKNFTDCWGSNSAASEPSDKKKKNLKKPEILFSQSGQGVRKCMHCEITKTPQWRVGPTGPKSLCNACGVRYKSGRLFPEYRPAASPTFVPALHSNSHKKVVEMRTKFGPDATMAIVRTEPEPELIPNINPVAEYI